MIPGTLCDRNDGRQGLTLIVGEGVIVLTCMVPSDTPALAMMRSTPCSIDFSTSAFIPLTSVTSIATASTLAPYCSARWGVLCLGKYTRKHSISLQLQHTTNTLYICKAIGVPARKDKQNTLVLVGVVYCKCLPNPRVGAGVGKCKGIFSQ